MSIFMEQNQIAVPTRPARILVVDDERYIARFLVYVLTEEGYEAQAVYDGEEALHAVAEFAPDAVLLDLLLPKLSGQEVLAKLRSDPRFAGLKILLLTGCPIQEEDTREPLSSSADAYCLKPIGPSVLIGLLRKLGLPSQVTR
jgi:two-component system, OmpR family, phosphate regulon response regulator PhoB